MCRQPLHNTAAAIFEKISKNIRQIHCFFRRYGIYL